MPPSISIRRFRDVISRLPEDPPNPRPGVWYLTQRQHWLGWLKYYHTEGAYGRQVDATRDAEYAYNHAVNYLMLIYLAKAIPLPQPLITSAEQAAAAQTSLMAKSGAIRKVIPWPEIYQAVFAQETRLSETRLKRMGRMKDIMTAMGVYEF